VVEEYQALREEILAKHNAAVATFTATFGIIAAIVTFADPGSARVDAPKLALACLSLQVLVFSSAMLIRSLFHGTSRIGTYIQVFHAASGERWEHANHVCQGGRYYFTQCRAMALAFVLSALLLTGYTWALMRSIEPDISCWDMLVALGAGLQIGASCLLWHARSTRVREAYLQEWRRLLNNQAFQPPSPPGTPNPEDASPAPPAVADG